MTFNGKYIEERTAHFLINNARRIKKVGGIAWHESSKIYKAMKLFKEDVKFSIRTKRD